MERLTHISPGRVETWEVARPELRSPDEAIVRPIAVATCDIDAAPVRGLTPWSGPFPAARDVEPLITCGRQLAALLARSPGKKARRK